MRYRRHSNRTVEMSFDRAREMVEWLENCRYRFSSRPLDRIRADIEREEAEGDPSYLGGEVVLFDSQRAAVEFKLRFCLE